MGWEKTAISVWKGAALLGVMALMWGCAPSKISSARISPTPTSHVVIPPKPVPPPAAVVAPVPPAPAPAKPSDSVTAHIPSLWPVKDNRPRVILSSYGYRGGRRGGPSSFHRAVDIQAAMNTPVIATASGIVTEAAIGRGYGKVIVIDHGNGYQTAYAHLNKFKVKKGQRVTKGEVIALSGRTGNATCPHVHYEVRKNSKAINPVAYLPMDGVRIEQKGSLTPPPPVRSRRKHRRVHAVKGKRRTTRASRRSTYRRRSRTRKSHGRKVHETRRSATARTKAMTRSTARFHTRRHTSRRARPSHHAASAKSAYSHRRPSSKHAWTRTSSSKRRVVKRRSTRRTSSKRRVPARKTRHGKSSTRSALKATRPRIGVAEN